MSLDDIKQQTNVAYQRNILRALLLVLPIASNRKYKSGTNEKCSLLQNRTKHRFKLHAIIMPHLPINPLKYHEMAAKTRIPGPILPHPDTKLLISLFCSLFEMRGFSAVF